MNVDLFLLDPIAVAGERTAEPVTVGVPFPRGMVASAQVLALETADGRRQPLQASVLSPWPDGSVKWALIDFQASSSAASSGYRLVVTSAHERTASGRPLAIAERAGEVTVTTGPLVVTFAVGAPFPLSDIRSDTGMRVDWTRSGLALDLDGVSTIPRILAMQIEDRGELRTRIRVTAEPIDTPVGRCEIDARVELFSGSATVKAAITIRNTAAADHPKGLWALGTPGSMYVKALHLRLMTEPIDQCRGSIAPDAGRRSFELPFELRQESSGGQHWDSPVHRQADGRIPVRPRGFRLYSGGVLSEEGLRASPLMTCECGPRQLSVALPGFWQNFPRSLTAAMAAIEIGFFPESDVPHELQAGEQKTHVAAVSFGVDDVSASALVWCDRPQRYAASPAWYCAAGVVPCLVTEAEDPHAHYLALVKRAIEGDDSFFAKREQIDEFGWRHFGDLYADHETVSHTGPDPLVSHYNNQYDAAAGFAMHFMRSGDRRWLELMDDLVHHVRDIDVYHTGHDKSAYNGGLFWHTYHYTDAGTATHRTYPREMGAGGGPSAEHNYTTGLLLHYYLTGNPASRDAAIGLAEWVLRMDDGRLTMFRWLAGGATGLASSSGSADYHGPGRGAANSILVCLNAYRLSGDRRFKEKAEELVRRCIHPGDDIEARGLLDIERRWYYTIYLQSLAHYLTVKNELGELDFMYAYARASLLRYARWMAVHERPYLETREQLEYPTETWAAQDMRKSDVLFSASLYATGEERALFRERARWFFDYSVSTLQRMPTSRFTRPTVLMLTNGYRAAWFAQHADAVAQTADPGIAFPPAEPFVPQKRRALRRARALIVAALVAGAAGLSYAVVHAGLFTR